ncbi:MAG: hypothetical protein JWN73_2065 [Betaproteobacteria bacterium]|nr:hypothetical protein [Betaproteobacteria bacterium]
MKPLSDRQERFIFEYTFDQNSTAAAGRAGYSDKTKGTHAAQMMKNPVIRERIVAELGDLFNRLKFNATFLLQSQINAAFLDPAKLFDAQEQPIALDKLDKETRDGLTVTYSKRRNGDYTMWVKQTPRHIALAVLQKRIDAFKKLEGEVFAQEGEKEEVAPVVVEAVEKQILPCGQNDSGGMAEVHAEKAPSASSTSSPSRIAQAIKNWLKLEFKLAEPMEKLVQVKTAIAQAVQSIGRKPEVDIALLWGSLADFAASQPVDRNNPPPLSPHDPGYNFKKDPDAMEGGRYTAWTLYWTEKRDQARHKAEEAVALGTAPPNMVIKAGRRVGVRTEPGYNPPWMRDNRPRVAIGADETYLG